MAVGVVRTAWAGTSGGPGVTQLYVVSGNGFASMTAAEAQTAVNAVRQFWFSNASSLPNEITLTVSPVVDQYDIPTGKLVSSVSAGTNPPSVVGTSAGTFTMAAGLKLNLNTTNVRNGRRVRGGIYVVPAAGTTMNTSGVVETTARAAFNSTAATLLSTLSTGGLGLVVYSRPIAVGEPKGPRSGGVSNVVAVETNEKGAILRGRRD